MIGKYGFEFVLLGQIQSYDIKNRFCWYRQLSGGKYFVSTKDIVTTEKKIKTISLLKHSKISLPDLKSSSKLPNKQNNDLNYTSTMSIA